MVSVAVGFLAVSSSVTLSVPYFIGSIIDIAYQLQDKGQLLDKMQSTATFLVTLFVMGAAANGARIYLIETSGQLFNAILDQLSFIDHSLFAFILLQQFTIILRHWHLTDRVICQDVLSVFAGRSPQF